MEESKKKPIMIAVIVVCLGLAGIITWRRGSGGGGTLDDIPETEKLWVKCNNPACKEEYQMGKKAYFKYIEEHTDPTALSVPGVPCEACGELSVYRAVKCANPDCGIVFFRGQAGAGHPGDRCPKCKHSEMEDSRKRRLAERAAETQADSKE